MAPPRSPKPNQPPAAVAWTRIFDPSPPLYLNVGVLGCLLLVIHIAGYASMPGEYHFATDAVEVERSGDQMQLATGTSTPGAERYRAELTMELVRGQLPHHAAPESAFERVVGVDLPGVPLGGSRLAADVGVYRWQDGAWLEASETEHAEVCLWISSAFTGGPTTTPALERLPVDGRAAAELIRVGGGDTIRGSSRRAVVYIASMLAFWVGLALIALALPGIALNARLTRKLRALTQRRCPTCSYSLVGQRATHANPDRTCPECGTPLRPLLAESRRRLRLHPGERGARRAGRLLFLPE